MMQVTDFLMPNANTLKRVKYLGIFAFCLALLGCTGNEGDDLDQFIRDAGNDMHAKIKPLPEVKPYLSFQFNADGTLSDPFKTRKTASKSGLRQPNLDRPREPMEAYPLESIKYVGMLTKAKLTFGLLKTPENIIQQVRIGNFVGQNFGVVSQIDNNQIVLKEVMQDEVSGDWLERVSVLTLQE